MKTVYYTTSNNGDGSYSVRFFESQECIDRLEEVNPEGYSCGEGGGSFQCDGELYGIHIENMTDVEEEISWLRDDD